MSINRIPELSIIVPVLNEAEELPELFATLESQSGVSFEVIICDGGSSDGTQTRAEQLAISFPHQVHCICTPRGRGCQMNAGAAAARSDILLFLHADSRFPDCEALSSAIQTVQQQLSESSECVAPVAARFALNFRRQQSTPSLAYAFYESKARLNRADCIRGDQGFMLPHLFFKQLGGFDESLPFLEDVRLAFAIEKKTIWILLPARISTSARRFEMEGLCERQVVNAIIANAVHQDWNELFTYLPGLYRCSADTGKLLLFPLLDGIRSLIAGHDPAWRRTFWIATGQYVAGNIWQLFYWLDVRRSFRNNQEAITPDRWSKFYIRFLEPYSSSQPLSAVTALAVWIWFRLLLVSSRRKLPALQKPT